MTDHKETPSIFNQNLDPNIANHQPLTPLTFLDWSATVYPDKTAVIYGDIEYTYREFARRCRLLASALSKRGIGLGDTVALMAPNTPPMLEAHYGVPMTGAAINGINIRLDATAVAFILEHGEARVLITDREFSPVVKEALTQVTRPITVIDIDDPLAPSGDLIGEKDYESFLEEGDDNFTPRPVSDEWEAIALNYTSGTTGNPKGVVFHHRGAFLNAMGNAMMFGLNRDSVYLWTLPMFHCNGWTYTWAVTAVAGTHVCLRRIDPAVIFSLIKERRITHMCGAPVVLGMLIHAPEEAKQKWDHTVEIATGGAAPPSPVIAAMEGMGFRVTHLYGLTETYGPASVCAWQDDWLAMPTDQKASMLARQGVRYPTLAYLTVANPDTLIPVPEDGQTIGEIMMRGNTVMKGYLKNPGPPMRPSPAAGSTRATWPSSTPTTTSRLRTAPRTSSSLAARTYPLWKSRRSCTDTPRLWRRPSSPSTMRNGARPPAPSSPPAPTPRTSPRRSYSSGAATTSPTSKPPGSLSSVPLPKTSTGKIQKFALRERANNL